MHDLLERIMCTLTRAYTHICAFDIHTCTHDFTVAGVGSVTQPPAGGAGALEAAQTALAASEAARTAAEAARSQAVAAHDADVAHLKAKLQEATEKQQGLAREVEALQASRVALEAQHTADETQMLAGLRGEAAALEQRLKDEQAAHAASIHQVRTVWSGQTHAPFFHTCIAVVLLFAADQLHGRLMTHMAHRTHIDKLTMRQYTCVPFCQLPQNNDHQLSHLGSFQAEQRQRELEATLSESAADLTSMQRQLAERQAAAASLQAALDQARSRPAAVVAAGPDPAAATLRAQCNALAAQLADSRAQLAAARQEAAQLAEQLAAQQGPAVGGPVDPPAQDLEARLHELSELLYAKQNQYERLAADKAAQQLAFQRQLQEAHVCGG